MKPNFALNITDSAISLLHRTSRGWLEVGSANFDAPDLEEALGYLRSSALGLSPHGITTKLILPPSQVLYTEVEAPGPDKAAREAQIRAALENRTPYAVDDLVFDWWGTGPMVKVAVVARETLDEAESFAETHRFNPVSFVTTPAEGQFAGEPWFGVTKLSASVLPAGEKVSRDQDPVKIVARDTAKPDAGTKAAVATAEAETEAAAEAEAAQKREAEQAREQELALEAEKAAQAEAQRAAQQQAAEEKAAAEAAEAAADAEALRKTEAAKAEMELRAQELAQAEAKRMVEEAEKAKAAQIEREKTRAALIEAERKRADLERVAAEKAAAEAAFDGVTSQSIAEAAGRKTAPEAEKADPAPAFSSRRVEAAAPTASATAPTLGPASAKPAAANPVTPTPLAGAKPEGSPAATAEGSKPKAPAAPMITSIAARKGPTGTGASPAGAPGAAAKPLNGTATFATGAKAELAKPKTEAAAVAAAGIAAAKVTAARIPGAGTALARFKSKSQKKEAPAAGQSAGTKSAAKQAAAGNSMGSFGSKMAPQRGKPRFLGLILTLVLLAALAAVAAWSSLYLSRDTGAEEAVMQADATSQTPPAVPAETQAEAEAELPPATDIAATGQPDNQPPAAEMVAGVAPAATAPDVAGTDAQAQAEGQVSGPQDEIILATTDQAQPNIDPLAAPRPVSRPDTAPTPATLPPPFGTQYEFEPDGTIKATAKGVVMPDGFWLIAAKPPTVPPARPAAISAPAAETAPDTTTAATPPPAANPAGVAADPAGASTAGVSRMEGTGPSSDFQADATVENRRPKNRAAVPALAKQDAATPDAAAESDDGAALTQDSAAVQLTSLRPRERSATVAAAAEEARKTAEAASLAATAAAEAAAKAAEEKTAQDAAQSGALSVALSPRPAARPRDFSGAVTAAIASASREATRQVAAPQAVPEPEEAEEPEVKVAAAPRIPTRANVAQQATFKNAINLSKINLIGVYGTDSKRYALVRSASGRYSKVRVGDKLDGGTVAAITRTEVRYKKGSRMLSLAMPAG